MIMIMILIAGIFSLVVIALLVFFLKWKGAAVSGLILVILIGAFWISSKPIMFQKSTSLASVKISGLGVYQEISKNDLKKSDINIEKQKSYTLKVNPSVLVGLNNSKIISLSSFTNNGLKFKTVAEAKSKLGNYQEYSTDQYPRVVRFVDKEKSLKLLLFSNDGKSIIGYWFGKI